MGQRCTFSIKESLEERPSRRCTLRPPRMRSGSSAAVSACSTTPMSITTLLFEAAPMRYRAALVHENKNKDICVRTRTRSS